MIAMQVLLVDDDLELDQMLTEYLSAEAFDVVSAADGASALELLAHESFDLVILDVMLPSLNGFDVLRQLRQSRAVPVIMLTARGEDTDRILGLELGADDYLAKPFNPKELLARMRAVLRRTSAEAKRPGEPIMIGALHLDPSTFEANIHGQPIRLTITEFRVLEFLMRVPGRAQSRELLTDSVLGRRLSPYDRSIDTHVSNLRRKLSEREDAGVRIRNVRGAGYMLTVIGGP